MRVTNVRAWIANRSGLAFALPSLCAATYVYATASGSIEERLTAALGASIVVPAGALIGYAVCLAIAATLLHEPRVAPIVTSLSAPHRLAGLFLVTFLWIWWQHSKESVVRDIARCIEREHRLGEQVDSVAVMICYEERKGGDDVEAE